MKVLKAIANVLGVLIALVLSLILTATLIATPVISAAGSFMQTDTLKKVVKNIDYIALMEDMDVSGTSGVDAELIASVMETGMVEDLVEIYADSIFAMLEGSADDVTLSAETVNDIMQKYLDDIVPIVKEMIGSEYEIPEEMIRSMTSDMLKQYSGEIADMFPSASDLGLDEEVVMAITLLRDGTILWAMIAVVAVISLLILACRFMRFKGFMWLGVVYLLCGGLDVLSGFGMRTTGLAMAVQSAPGTEAIVEPIMGVLASEMMKGGGVLAGLAVLFIVIFVLGRVMLKKRHEKLENEQTYQEEIPNEWV